MIIAGVEYDPIWLSTWTFKAGKEEIKVKGVVVKGTNPNTIRMNQIYINRASRTLRTKSTPVAVKLDTQLGFGIKE